MERGAAGALLGHPAREPGLQAAGTAKGRRWGAAWAPRPTLFCPPAVEIGGTLAAVTPSPVPGKRDVVVEYLRVNTEGKILAVLQSPAEVARHLRDRQRHPARASQGRAPYATARRRGGRPQSGALPRPAPNLRQPPDHRPRARRRPGQPHPWARQRHHHAQHLHHLFDGPRHATEIRTPMASSPFARLLEPDGERADNVVVIARRPARKPAARARTLGRART
jgi:hypothetical protein